jgi:hypothetical protein
VTPPGQEGAEALAGGAGQVHVDGVVRQAGVAMALGHLVREHGAAGTVDVADGDVDDHLLAPLQGRLGLGDELMIQGLGETVILNLAMAAGHVAGHRRHVEDAREVQALGLPVLDALAHVEQVGAADHLVEPAEAQLAPSVRALPRRRRRSS